MNNNCHTVEESLHEIRELLVKLYPEAVRIDVAVTADEITAIPIYRTDLSGYTMRNVSGKWAAKANKGEYE